MFGSVLFSSGLIRLLDFQIFSLITVNTVFSVMKILFPFFFVFRYYDVYVYLCIFLLSVLPMLGVLGPWEFLWRAGSYTFCVCVSAV